MTPTLLGRIQTRLVLLANIGVLWLLAVAWALPGADGVGILTRIQIGLVALGVTAALGALWELIYHLGQQLRWEKDWPTLFGLLTGIPEGALVYLVLGRLASAGVVPGVGTLTFVTLFASTWLLVWLVGNGPLRVLVLRWRYRGGELW